MQISTGVSKLTFGQILSDWLFYPLSDKLKLSIKISLSFTLAYMLPLYFGWPSPSTGAITIMIIAAMDSMGASIQKGLHRIIGSIIGACIGVPLIALFAQDRMLYLISMSLLLTIFLYLYRASKSDATIYMLAAIMIMAVFQESHFEFSFTYAANRILMISFGVLVYTAVSVFLWPENVQEIRLENAKDLSGKQKDIFLEREDESKDLIEELYQVQDSLVRSALASADEAGNMSMSNDQWNSVVYSYKEISRTLTLLTYHHTDIPRDELPSFLDNYNQLESETLDLLDNLHIVWDDQKEFNVPDAFEVVYNTDKIATLSHLSKARFLTTVDEIKKLHTQLRELASKINKVLSMKPSIFADENIPPASKFNWFDIDDIKTTFVAILAYWVFVFIWIFFNPPGGFIMISFAIIFSLYTLNATTNTLVMIIVFALSSVYGVIMYIFVLPHLHYAWELAIFIFAYAFVAFHIVGVRVAALFLMSIYMMGIDNQMNYDFNLFLLLLFFFYLFLFILLFFYYIPFSTRPEHQFLNLKKRYFSYVKTILLEQNAAIVGKGTWFGNVRSMYALYHLTSTMKKMKLWASKIDTKYFDSIDQKELTLFLKECETLAYMLEMIYGKDSHINDNSAIKAFKTENIQVPLEDLLDQYSADKKSKDIDPVWRDEKQIVGMIEKKLEDFLIDKKREQYSEKEIIDFYENISLGNHVWRSLLNCQNMMKELDFKVLERSRF